MIPSSCKSVDCIGCYRRWIMILVYTVYPKKYAHGFVVLCFVVVMQSFIMNSHEVFIHIHQGCFADTGAIVRLPQCQWSKPDGYGEISQCITTTKHSRAKTVCIFLGIYCKCTTLQMMFHIDIWHTQAYNVALFCLNIVTCLSVNIPNLIFKIDIASVPLIMVSGNCVVLYGKMRICCGA